MVMEYIPWDEMFWDPHSRKENLEDRSWCGRVQHLAQAFQKL